VFPFYSDCFFQWKEAAATGNCHAVGLAAGSEEGAWRAGGGVFTVRQTVRQWGRIGFRSCRRLHPGPITSGQRPAGNSRMFDSGRDRVIRGSPHASAVSIVVGRTPWSAAGPPAGFPAAVSVGLNGLEYWPGRPGRIRLDAVTHLITHLQDNASMNVILRRGFPVID
jgi:hypothetical protein